MPEAFKALTQNSYWVFGSRSVMVQYVSLTFSVCSEMTTAKHLQCLYTVAHSSPNLPHTVELGCIVLGAEFSTAPCAPHPLISCQAVSQCLCLKQQKSDGTRAEAILLLISHSSSYKIWIVSAFLSQLATGTLLASTFEGSARAVSAKAVLSQGWDILVLWFFVCLCILGSYSLLLALW